MKLHKKQIVGYIVLWIMTIIFFVILQLSFRETIKISGIIVSLIFSTIIYTILNLFVKKRKGK